ncbi:MAG TPA: glycosyltransferase family 2 protein, partial [Thermodesulfobacteriota bacterium]|nr:glycosyltransferase family 2 protein [Thermodesulfobacteriota bacterium]
ARAVSAPRADAAAAPRPRLSVAMICCNEARIIDRALASVAFADEIVVVDSGSTDGTLEIARRHTPHVYQHPWLGYAAQKNLAIERTRGEWILSLDADEIVEPDLAAEIQAIVAGPSPFVAYRIPRKLVFLGRVIRHGGWYPDLNLRLFRRGAGRFPPRRVHEHLRVEGPVGRTRGALRHESHPTLEAYLDTMNRYSTLAVEEMAAGGGIPRWRVSAPALLLRPAATFLYRYLVLGGFLDGRPGLILNLLHSGYVLAKYAKAYERLLGVGAAAPGAGREAAAPLTPAGRG